MRLVLTLLLIIALLTSLLMMANVLEDPARFDRLYSSLLVISSLGLIMLIVLIGLNVYDLVAQVRHKRPGARLTVRLVLLFLLLTTTPVLLVYYFSVEFLHQRLENWFDVRVESGVKNALELSRESLTQYRREALQKTQNLAYQMAGISNQSAALELNVMRDDSQATELALLETQGRIIAVSSAEPNKLLPTHASEPLSLPPNSDLDYAINLEPVPPLGVQLRVLVKCPPDPGKPTSEGRLLAALFPFPEHVTDLANSVEESAAEYQRLSYLRQPLINSFTLVLSLVLLLSIFSAAWAAFITSRRLVAPIRDLAEGTRAVARGDYDQQVPFSQLDELGFLVESFNHMTDKLRTARDAAKHNQQLADDQLAYLEIILERLSSGVLSLDHKLRLRTSNAAAAQILGVNLNTLLGQNLLAVCDQHPPLQALCEAAAPFLQTDEKDADWQAELTLFDKSGRKILICRGTRLPALANNPAGHVLVFDNITTLVQAQRNAAWTEVARRLAHEIKNPLTPIRLSAERLRHKYLPSFPDKEAETLDRMTHTIIQQVESLRTLVNAFSDYARSPQIQLKHLQLNELIREVLDLYQNPEARINTRLAPDLPLINADQGRLRQVLHNLLKNALEAGGEEALVITVSTRYHASDDLAYVELRVQDNGKGVPDDMLGQVFEPYVTAKVKGSGLGLAIVKKIVEEHNGLVSLENCHPGACVNIRLPLEQLDSGATL